MALTALETAEQRLPCHVAEHGDGGGSKATVAAEQAVPPQETDHGGSNDDDDDGGQRRPERDDVWSMIQSQPQPKPAAPVRRSSSLLSQKSLEICTESLGSETGSDGYSDADGAGSERGSSPESEDDDAGSEGVAAREATMPARAFPPPLPSLARRTVASTLQMRQHRRDGRLVVEAVPVLSSTLLRAQRRGGRLLLCFADTASDEEKNHGPEPEQEQKAAQEQTHEEEDEEEEEEVEVVDRGTVVEVKVVSTQPQAHSSGGARVHRSSLVINKFVGAEPVSACETNDAAAGAAPQKVPAAPPTAVTAAAASALSAARARMPEEGDDGTTSVGKPSEGKLLMTTTGRRRSKQELLNHMRRCGQLSGQLFIWEPRVATSS